jgi:hypothetical protein
MPKLSNNILREKSMKDFLNVMRIDSSGVEVTSVEGLFSFSFNDASQVDLSVDRLNTFIHADGEVSSVKSLSLSEIIDNEIEQAISNDPLNSSFNSASCKAILDVIKNQGLSYVFSQESGFLEITLPSPVYASILNLLNYPHLVFSADGKLILDIKKYLHDTQETVVKMTGFTVNQPPLVFLNTDILETKKIFYATSKLDDGTVEVTPYFFVPQALTPPTYHIVIDVSDSMNTILSTVQRNVKSLAQQLFIFQPAAELTITTFSAGIHSIGTFKTDQLPALNRAVDALQAQSDTPLYEVTANFIDKITADNKHNSVLLFTDGEEGGSKYGSEQAIREKIAILGTEPSTKLARNKFFVFSYKVSPQNLIREVAKTFASDVVETTSADFVEVQDDPERLKKWAATRELFTINLVVTDSVEHKNKNLYQRSIDMSGQLVMLDSRRCQPGDTIDIEILDGSERKVISSSKKLRPLERELSPEVADLISKFRFMPMPVSGSTQPDKTIHLSHEEKDVITSTTTKFMV